jgi:serine-type D-Ala-D-Ala carboxypeptidase/endopeptidase (penicillin-binding protein 4)
MMRFPSLLRGFGSVLLLLLSPVAVLAADKLAEELNRVIHRPAYKQAHWGLLIVDASTGQTLYEHHPDRLFAPASTTKLYSCAVALCRLGPDFRFKTPVYRTGPVEHGVLKGNLVLVASGDLALGGRTDRDGHMAFRNSDHIYANGNTKGELTDTDPLAGLKDLARQVKAAGIRAVHGDVLIDDRLFEQAHGSGSGPDLLTPILVNDNLIDVLITPGARAGEPAIVKLRPETSYVQVDAQIKTVARDEPMGTWLHTEDGRRLVITGQMPLGHRPLVRIVPVSDPAGFARALFIETLRREGVAVKASPIQSPQAALPEKTGLERVAQIQSPPLAEAIKVTLKVSHNLYASTLPLLLAAYAKSPGDKNLAHGLLLQGKTLKSLGVPVETISFGGGAGGARADMVTPRATVALLRAMRKRPEWQAYKAGLPVLGVDGTLADVVGKDSPARGKVMAKTGTLAWHDGLNDRLLLRSKALAGVMTTARGRKLAFAFFVNDVPLPHGTEAEREGKVLGKVCEIVYRSCP